MHFAMAEARFDGSLGNISPCLAATTNIASRSSLVGADDVRRLTPADGKRRLKMIADQPTLPKYDDLNQVELGNTLPAERGIDVCIHINTRVCLKIGHIVNPSSIARLIRLRHPQKH